MKSIKKLSILAVAAILSFGIANAQVGVQAGYSSSKNVSFSNSPALNGFHVGPTYEMSIQGPISLQYGLLYNFLTKSSDGLISTKTTAHRVDLPVRVQAGFPLGDALKVYVFAGPNFDFGISQVGSASVNLGGESIGAEGDNIYDGDNFSRFDLQLGAGAGISFNNIGVRVSYDWGMLDRIKADAGEWKNNDLKASLIVSF